MNAERADATVAEAALTRRTFLVSSAAVGGGMMLSLMLPAATLASPQTRTGNGKPA
jgi:hypothetical protein